MSNNIDIPETSPSADDPPGLAGIEAVLLDAGNTLVFVDRRRVREIFREAGGVEVPVDRFREAEYEARLSLARAVEQARGQAAAWDDGEAPDEAAARGDAVAREDAGAPDDAARRNENGGATGIEDHVWREYFLTLFRECGVSESAIEAVGERIKEIHDAEHLWNHVEEDTGAVLDELRELGYRLAVVSNADGRVERLLEDVGVRDRFEFVLDSHVVGVEKPDPRIFLQACERLGLEPGQCLYVGDLYPVDVVGARAAGLRAVLLDPMGRLDYPVDRIRGLGELRDYLDGGMEEAPRADAG